MRNFLSWYSPRLPFYLVYMLQQVNYRPPKFLQWLKRSPNLTKVMHRKTLDKTKAAKVLLLFTAAVWVAIILKGILLFTLFENPALRTIGIFGVVFSPFLTGLALVIAVYLAHLFIAAPKEAQLVNDSKRIFKVHPAITIGVAGSYGKTSFKEILATILKEKFITAVTPGNMNTPIAHARFAAQLDGDEEILIIEYGEEYPGDTEKFIEITRPDYAVLLGLAPNHLDYYKTLDALAKDLLSLRKLKEKLLVNGESKLLRRYLKKSDNIFTIQQAGDWKISDVKVSLEGTSFTLSGKRQKLFLKSGLLGRHFVVPIAMAAMLAHQLGLTKKQIEDGVAKTVPFEHRMQPRHVGGAIILDDTYNGNVEGLLAGLDLLKELPAKRKIYVTPGLVDQGEETKNVHHQIAKKMFDVKPDLIVLMDNSATKIIEEALAKLNYQGLVQIESDPLNFYQNIDKIIAAGDVVMMQNDWTDNYN